MNYLYQHVNGDGSRWVEHAIGPNTPPPPDFQPYMEGVSGEGPPRYFIWENVDGVSSEWQEHVVLDAYLCGHESVVGDITGNG